MFPKQAFILAGGKGERLRPLTNDIPKPMVKVQEKPILEHVIKRVVNAGVEEIIIAVSYKAEKVEEHFGDGTNFRTKISYIREQCFLGTGGALKNAQNLIKDKFIMLNGDTLMDIDFEKMNEFHEEKTAVGTLALIQVHDVTGYGVTRLEGDKILEFIEKPSPENAPSKWINAGAYILEKNTLELLPKEFNLIEKTLFPSLASIHKLYGFRHFGQWFPTDDMQKLVIAQKEWKGD